MSNTQNRKSPVKLNRLVLFPVTADTEDALTYGEARPMTKALMTATATPSVATANQSADDQVVDTVTVKAGGTLAIGITALNDEDRTIIFGETFNEGQAVVSHKDDIASDLGVAYATGTSDGKINLFKYLKAKFTPSETSAATMESGGITFQGETLNGTYANTINNGIDMGSIRGLDPVEDAERIEKWFTVGEYMGEPIVGG